jgi:hypothetical protein
MPAICLEDAMPSGSESIQFPSGELAAQSPEYSCCAERNHYGLPR